MGVQLYVLLCCGVYAGLLDIILLSWTILCSWVKVILWGCRGEHGTFHRGIMFLIMTIVLIHNAKIRSRCVEGPKTRAGTN